MNNPENEIEAIYVVEVPKSPEAPHMTSERYFTRAGSTSRAMDNIQVKNAMLGSGRLTALKYEISTNSVILDRAIDVFRVPFEGEFILSSVVFVPFHTDVWKSIIASGYISVLSRDLSKELFAAYRLFDEVNALIEWAKLGEDRWSTKVETRFVLSIGLPTRATEVTLHYMMQNYFALLLSNVRNLKELLKDF